MIGLRVTPYDVTFRAPTRDASGERSERHGALLTLSAGALCGAGELTPLPGRSRETLAACLGALEALDASKLPGVTELQGPGWLAAIQRAAALLPAELAAARHALETALLDVCSRLRGEPCAALLAHALGRPEPASRLPLAALIDTVDPDQAVAQAELHAARGISCAKLKIAGVESNGAILERARRVGSKLRLRVDANRSLSPGQSAALAPGLAELGVEFIEEPLPLADLPVAAAPTLPLAVDESLLDDDFSLAKARERGVSVLVLKPMLLGFLTTLALCRSAAEAGFDVVLSHTFDGPRAMAATRSLALALGPRRYADGLASHAALDAWPEPVPGHVTSAFIGDWSAPGLGVP